VPVIAPLTNRKEKRCHLSKCWGLSIWCILKFGIYLIWLRNRRVWSSQRNKR